MTKQEKKDNSLMVELDALIESGWSSISEYSANCEIKHTSKVVWTLDRYTRKICKKCNSRMQRRIRANGNTKTGQSYFYIAWDVCLECNNVQLNERYKIKATDDYEQALRSYLQNQLTEKNTRITKFLNQV